MEAEGQSHPLDIVADTGYTETRTLPPDLIAQWKLPFNRFGKTILADGTEIEFNIYNLTLIWDGNTEMVQVDEVDAEPLLGMSLLTGYQLTVEAKVGGKVKVVRL